MQQPPKRPAPIGVRFTEADLSYIDHVRSDMSRHAYIRAQALDPFNPPKRHRKTPAKDHKALSEVIAKLGQSRIASNLNQLAKAANSGSLLLTPEIETELCEALTFIAEVRRLLIEALGLAEGDP